ncbi:cyclic nucleotide-binding domain-containing protein [candidate division WOR-3 bacterium]|jgi:CRP/FNR family transcriptional regulator|nr:cyclic nucleotide-binding domain-containing protein [candidate division WOR-3 bacterium]
MPERDIGYEKTLGAEETLFREGDEGDQMYLIKSGKIRIVKEMSKGEEKTLAVLEAGAFFGEMAVLDKRPRSASAIAETDTELIIVNRDVFLRKINENPFIKYVILTLTERLRKTDDMLKYVSVHNEQMRFIHYLSDKGRKNDKGTGEYIDTGIDIHGKEITNMIGLDSYKIKEFLNRLTKYNIVELQDTIIIKSMEKLNKYQDFIALQEEFER